MIWTARMANEIRRLTQELEQQEAKLASRRDAAKKVGKGDQHAYAAAMALSKAIQALELAAKEIGEAEAL